MNKSQRKKKNNIKKSIKCKATEIGKMVINRCLQRGIKIDTLKLEKLLIIMQGIMLAKYNKSLFDESITYINDGGFIILQINRDFLYGFIGFYNIENECISLLSEQEEVVNYVIDIYGEYDTAKLENLDSFKKLRKIIRVKQRKNDNKPILVLPYHVQKAFEQIIII